MPESIYTISQASELVGRPSYVLRYWEEELTLPIGRNEMGHRYYTENDIQLFLNIKELQKKGLQLRAIKDLVPKFYEQEAQTEYIDDKQEDLSGELEEYKMKEFQTILEKLITQGVKDRQAMERESRVRNLDETIRLRQQSRRQAAATTETAGGRKKAKRSKRHNKRKK